MHTTCLNLSEALSGHYPFDLTPRLHSLRSLSLGLLKSVPLRGTVRVSLFGLSTRLHSLRSLSLGLSRVSLRGCEVSIQRVVPDGCRVRPLWPSAKKFYALVCGDAAEKVQEIIFIHFHPRALSFNST